MAGQLRLGVEPNTGQWPAEVLYSERAPNGVVQFERDAMRVGNGVKVQLVDQLPQARPVMVEELATRFNLYPGKEGERHFRNVVVENAYAGVTVTWMGRPGGLNLAIAAGGRLDAVRLRIVNLPIDPLRWLVVNARQGERLMAEAQRETTDTYRIHVPGLDRSKAAEVEVLFPNGLEDGFGGILSPTRAADGNLYLTRPFGGAGLVARLNEAGEALWVTLVTGSGMIAPSYVGTQAAGVIALGTTGSASLPLAGNAPGGESNGFALLLDRESGVLRQVSYLPFEFVNFVPPLLSGDGDVIVAGFTKGVGSRVARWRPTLGRVLYGVDVEGGILDMKGNAVGNVVYASTKQLENTDQLQLGALSAAGTPVGRMVTVNLPRASGKVAAVQILPGNGLEVAALIADGVNLVGGSLSGVGYVGSFSLADGTTKYLRSMGRVLGLGGLQRNSAGEILASVVTYPKPLMPTSPNAVLVAPCENSTYYNRIGASGELLYATYLNGGEAEPARRQASLQCATNTAGRMPRGEVVRGQTATLTGGNFGPSEVVYAGLDGTGKFGTTLEGYSVRIGGVAAPVLAVGRGAIAVQVPYEAMVEDGQFAVTMSGPGAPSTEIRVRESVRDVQLFDTGEVANEYGLPAVAALNEDGTYNSVRNPAPLGSIVAVFGSGMPFFNTRPVTGALNPIDVRAEARVFALATNATPVFWGPAPGQLNGIFQVNLRLTEQFAGTGVRAMPFALTMAPRPNELVVNENKVVVWVTDRR